ncbi:IclR family transcriptional regulator [Sphingoaurantiacus capsulatus]|uniref:IclR family transcriptional regulator n=1 Tax=Sphingoaurantiacus capsulatus TaxID=1771310 RepID=A0ABV7X5K0_9SPHN
MVGVVKSAARAFDVLEYFEAVCEPLSLKQVADHFAWPVSSAAALLKSMVVKGYLDYDRFTRTYMPTMRLATLGHWVSDKLFEGDEVLAVMRELQDLTGETISLGAQSDLQAQHIHVLPSRSALTVQLRPGTCRPLLRSGLGTLLLSARTDEIIDRLVRRVNIEQPDPSKRERFDEVIARVNEVRELGHVYARHTYVQGAAIIGMLLPRPRLGRVMAINVIGPDDRLAALHGDIVATLHERLSRMTPRDDADTYTSEEMHLDALAP